MRRNILDTRFGSSDIPRDANRWWVTLNQSDGNIKQVVLSWFFHGNSPGPEICRRNERQEK